MATGTVLEVDGLEVAVVLGRARTLRLGIRPDGSVRLSGPAGASRARMEQFVRANRAWIELSRTKVADRLPPGDVFSDGGRALLWGKWWPVRLTAGGPEEAVLGDTVDITADSPEGAERALLKLRARLLEARVQALAPAAEAAFGQRPAHYRCRTMVSRWGSCNPVTRVITLNTWLTQHDEEALRYALVHELAHLGVSGHGPEFYAAVEAVLPGWRKGRDLLHRHAPPRR